MFADSPFLHCPDPIPDSRSHQLSVATPGAAFNRTKSQPPITDNCLLGRRHTIQFSKSFECQGPTRVSLSLYLSSLRPSCDRTAGMLGLIPSGYAGLKPSSTTSPLFSAYHFEAQKASCAPSQAAEFDCLKLRGLKQAGGFLTGDPLASSPYPNALRVSTSEESQPSRCGALKLARLKHWINRALATSSTFVLAIRNITERFP